MVAFQMVALEASLPLVVVAALKQVASVVPVKQVAPAVPVKHLATVGRTCSDFMNKRNKTTFKLVCQGKTQR